MVLGNAYVLSSFKYTYAHLWRNIGILFGFWVFFTGAYLAASGFYSSASGKLRVMKFLRKDMPKSFNTREMTDPIAENRSAVQELINPGERVQRLASGNTIFLWQNAIYEVKVRSETRRLLDNVSGWVKSGSLTALMGVSGAGKTTLLDFLAGRLRSGTLSGELTLHGMEIPEGAIEKLGKRLAYP